MEKIILFGILSVPVILISWRTLFNVRSHGFYRFFSWECILWLFVSNVKYWFTDPLSIKQLISWICLVCSAYLVVAGILVFKREGKIDRSRDEKNLLGFEKTTELIDQGIYKYIRHPLYASLFYLTWGIYFKNTTLFLLIIALLSSVFLYFTSRLDEKECMAYFGDKYREYMTRSKMFVPFVF
jgi:protein-S-isoprenylcysteine O-methyltransferase Ste14